MKTMTRRYLQALFHDCGVVELRLLGKRIRSGLFDSLDALAGAAFCLDGNLYTTLNAPKPRVVSNRLGPDGRSALKDQDMAWIVRLPFDFDPVRPIDTPSTDEELKATYDTRGRLLAFLDAIGWPDPLMALSGNGYHLQYRLKLPANDETRQLLRGIYAGLAREFTTERARFDQSIHNPSRIFRLYGTLNRKGTATPDRPHRLTNCWVPDNWQIVTRAQLEDLGQRLAPPPRKCAPVVRVAVNGQGDYRTLDVVAWFQSHGLYKRPSPDPGKHYVTCPWLSEHSSTDHPMKTDTVVWEATENWPTYHCSHDHCQDRGIIDVMKLWGDADRFCLRQWEKRHEG
ncbi:MAG: hypothetical protein ACE1ZA_18850 [Pseudomonadales bacterium]